MITQLHRGYSRGAICGHDCLCNLYISGMRHRHIQDHTHACRKTLASATVHESIHTCLSFDFHNAFMITHASAAWNSWPETLIPVRLRMSTAKLQAARLPPAIWTVFKHLHLRLFASLKQNSCTEGHATKSTQDISTSPKLPACPCKWFCYVFSICCYLRF